jgi:acetamidase/formamidase
MTTATTAVPLLLVLGSFASAHLAAQTQQVDVTVLSTPQNLTWGDFPADKAPVARVRSGQVVRINTITHAGATQEMEPVAFMAQDGIPRSEVLQDQIDFWASRAGRPREGRSGHVLTGPVYVEGADPGDMLEIQILDIETRVPWGVNNTGATSGVFAPAYPGSRDGDPRPPMAQGQGRHVIRTGMENVGGISREVAFFSPEIHIPLAPFFGIVAVAPNPTVGEPGVTVHGVQSSRPPGPFGGNMDLNDLGEGATLYLPVFHPGALVYVGDSHSLQGDGEVSGTAIEQSLTGVFRFVVHEGRSIDGPWAETATHWIMMGIDLDLDRALQKAVTEVIDFLVAERGLTPDKAFSLASIAVDFHIGEAVDLTQLVAGMIPKGLFP